MNSFSTSDDTKAFLGKSHGDLMSESNVELLQNKSPKVDAKTMAPIEWSKDADLEWCARIRMFVWSSSAFCTWSTLAHALRASKAMAPAWRAGADI